MTEDRFDELMHDAERTYRNPPQPDFDAMWKSIERQHFGAAERSAGFRFAGKRWVGIAATLIVGIGIGRASMLIGGNTSAQTDVIVAAADAAPAEDPMARPYELETSQYLGQTAALLVALPSEMRASGGASAQFTSRAGELLSRTRLLMDSPAATDPMMRTLLEDLELVLMQVARLESGNRTDLDLINRALEQRDVIPRLRRTAADISAN